MTRIVFGNVNAQRTKVTGIHSAEDSPTSKELLARCQEQPIWSMIENAIDPLEDIADSDLSTLLLDDPPVTLKEGGVIKNGVQ